MFMLLAGGGIRGGQVLGESDDKATGPARTTASRPTTWPPRSIHTLGIDHTKEYHTNTGRPIMIVRDGHVMNKLFG